MVYLHWHAWASNNAWLLSNEMNKKLFQFDSFDDMINHLWLNDNKDVARAFNKQHKGLLK